jgi:hypothetical protein
MKFIIKEKIKIMTKGYILLNTSMPDTSRGTATEFEDMTDETLAYSMVLQAVNLLEENAWQHEGVFVTVPVDGMKQYLEVICENYFDQMKPGKVEETQDGFKYELINLRKRAR